MKILLLADIESKGLWDYFSPEKVKGYDLIISCGDLNPHYLTLLATFTAAPVLYVHGNHDTRYETDPPEGCICIEDTVYNFRGLRIAGLGGSIRYKPGAFQYTELEMRTRVRKLRRQIRRNKGFDLLITHSPAKGLNDGEDLPHQGFECFNELIDEYHPQFFVHGHVHLSYSTTLPRCCQKEHTQVINAYEKYELEIEDPEMPPPTWRDKLNNWKKQYLSRL